MIDKKLFDSLTDNAIDFLNQSIEEIQTKPKYAVINFCASVELLLKARLMDEHWALLLKHPEKAELAKFRQGDFISVSMEDAIARLEKVVGESIPHEAKKSLGQVRKHRNSLIHFFNPGYVGKPKKRVVAEIVAEQCKAWYHLHKLLTERWQATFKKHLNKIDDANRKMLGLRPFLRVKYDAIRGKIEQAKKTGERIHKCTACGFQATHEENTIGPLSESDCWVCNQHSAYLRVPCPECKTDIIVEDQGQGTCGKCGEEIDLAYLLDKYGEHGSPKDEMIEPSHAYCSMCEWFENPTVITIDGRWLCLVCFDVEDGRSDCAWCGQRFAGHLEDSSVVGCPMCGGMLGYQLGKDD